MLINSMLSKSMEVSKGKTPIEFFNLVTQDAKVLSSLSLIIQKMEDDGFMRGLHDAYQTIMTHEAISAQEELKKLDCKQIKIDKRTLISSNLYIFKENLKVISGFISKIKSRPNLEG